MYKQGQTIYLANPHRDSVEMNIVQSHSGSTVCFENSAYCMHESFCFESENEAIDKLVNWKREKELVWSVDNQFVQELFDSWQSNSRYEPSIAEVHVMKDLIKKKFDIEVD